MLAVQHACQNAVESSSSYLLPVLTRYRIVCHHAAQWIKVLQKQTRLSLAANGCAFNPGLRLQTCWTPHTVLRIDINLERFEALTGILQIGHLEPVEVSGDLSRGDDADDAIILEDVDETSISPVSPCFVCKSCRLSMPWEDSIGLHTWWRRLP